MANLTFDFLHHYQRGERRESDPANAYQYDEGHLIEAVLPETVTSVELHYWTRGMEEAEAYTPSSITANDDGSCTVLGNIPNKFFETDGDLRVYIVVNDAEASITTYEGKIHVVHRAMPDDYVDEDPDNPATRILTEARAAAATATAAAQTAQNVADSIPSDYSQMSEDVTQLKEDYTTILESVYVTDTASGSIASFPDGADNVPVKSLTVAIEPVQDLHGQESPWPAGGGKNIFNPVTWLALGSNTRYYTVSSDETITITANDTSGVADRLFDVDPGESYSMLSTGFSEIKIFNSNSDSIIGRVSGTFTAPADGKIAIKFYASSYPTSGKLIIVKSGAVPTAWSPYENICPISGHSQAVVTRTGKNLFGGTYNEFFTLHFESDKTVIVSADSVGSGTPQMGFYDENKVQIDYLGMSPDGSSVSGRVAKVIELPKESYYVKFIGAESTRYMIELGNTNTTFESYVGNTYDITFPTEAGTVYGGTLDVGTGVLTVDRKYRLLNGVNGDGVTYAQNGHTANTTRAFIRISDKAYGANNMISSSFFCQASGDSVGIMIGRAAGNGVEFFLNPSVPDTEEGVKAWFAENPTDLVYELAEPLTVQLTANEISTLLGTNNIWSDAGTVDVEYRADTRLYIEKLTAPTEDDMVADHAISANTFFMIGNTLYRSTTAIASGATITVGTNATKLSLSDALNALS